MTLFYAFHFNLSNKIGYFGRIRLSKCPLSWFFVIYFKDNKTNQQFNSSFDNKHELKKEKKNNLCAFLLLRFVTSGGNLVENVIIFQLTRFLLSKTSVGSVLSGTNWLGSSIFIGVPTLLPGCEDFIH